MTRAKTLLQEMNEVQIGSKRNQHLDRHQVLPGGNAFAPTGKRVTVEKLKAGAYIPKMTMSGAIFELAEINTDEMMKFDHPVHNKIREKVRKFWKAGPRYEKLGFTHSFGYLVEGPPGSGKTMLFKQVMEEAIEQDEIVFICRSVGEFTQAVKEFREVEPKRKVLAVMEDIEQLIKYGDHSLIQLMDGDQKMEGIFYLGSTNYPEQIPPRVKRKGRFSETIHLGYPPKEGLRAYLEMKLGTLESKANLDALCKACEGLSFAHLRDLVIGIYCEEQSPAQVIADVKGVQVSEIKGFVNFKPAKITENLSEHMSDQDPHTARMIYLGYGHLVEKDSQEEITESKGRVESEVSRAAKLLGQMEAVPKIGAPDRTDDVASVLGISPDRIKTELRKRLDFFGISGVFVDEVEIEVEGDIRVDLSDDDKDQMSVVFLVDPESQDMSAIIVDPDEDSATEDDSAIVVDLSPLNPSMIQTPVGNLVDLIDLSWMNKSTLMTILKAGEIGDDERPQKNRKQDAFGNFTQVECNGEDICILGKDDGSLDEGGFTLVVRGGKKVKLPIVLKKKRKVLTGAQRAGLKRAAIKRKQKKSQINRKRAKSLKLRKRSNIKKKKLAPGMKVAGTANKK